ncbi:MAG: nucleotidyltransferase domain-containing protein [Rhodospirillaceae bacterium]|nr:nucleotidyltransferase domain-containing protein [Rhodospirillales bacterium]
MAVFSDGDIIAAVRAVLPDVQALTLFGSRAQGVERPDSDLDIAVMLPAPADPVSLWESGETIARTLNVDVDLVDLRKASTVMQFQIITTGRHLLAVTPELERYEAFIMAEMMDLNEARAPLLADIQREGRVHG